MAPKKKVIVKVPDLRADIRTAVSKLSKVLPKVSAADQTNIKLEIEKLKAFDAEIKGLCKGKMTHAFSPADGGDPE
jgi:hypothetical protein